jgi:ribosomal protein S18 acetylase RimI-like enzyme
VARLVEACDLAVLGRTDSTEEQVAADLANPAYDRERSGVLVTDPAGDVVGWLLTEDDTAELFVDPYALDPTLLAWLLDRGVEHGRLLSAERGAPMEVGAGAFEQDAALAGALTAAGFVVRRRFWRMRLDLDPAARPVLLRPAGIEIRGCREDDADLRLLHAMFTESFAEAWNSPERSFHDWLARLDGLPGQDPSQRWVATVGGAPAGFLIADESRAEHNLSYVRTLGVRPAYRGGGVAKALLGTAFAHAAARGREAVLLTVDSENVTGATRLYESVGMRVQDVVLAWGLRVQPR